MLHYSAEILRPANTAGVRMTIRDEGLQKVGERMTERPNRIRTAIHRIERRIDAARGPRTATGEIESILFRSYGTSRRLDVGWRVVRRRAIVEAADAGTPWKSLVETWRRAASREIPGVRVTVRFGVQSVEVITDDEGYLHAAIEYPAMPGISGWQQVTAELTVGGTATSGHVLVPPPTAEFGIISDIDDTIVETNAVSLMRMARTVLLQNARGRVKVAAAHSRGSVESLPGTSSKSSDREKVAAAYSRGSVESLPGTSSKSSRC